MNLFYSSDISSYEVRLQKIITIQDLTLCLDKMDTSGKIEIYQVFHYFNQIFNIFLIIKWYKWQIYNTGSSVVSMFFNHPPDHELLQQHGKESLDHETRSALPENGVQHDRTANTDATASGCFDNFAAIQTDSHC